MGYEPTTPEGTFYVMARAPIADDEAFAGLLADENIVVLPGTIVELPGWFRISLTASDAMVESSLSGFERARERALAGGRARVNA
jgi:aspartate aminotransferase